MNNQFKYRPIALAILVAFPLLAGAVESEPAPGDVTQTATNSSLVSNTASEVTDTIGRTAGADTIDLGTSASVSISATGAAASVSISTINGALPNPVVEGVALNNITQIVSNDGLVLNQGPTVSDLITPLSIDLYGGNLAIGASTSISATGAAASVSVTAINDGSYDAENGDLVGFTLPVLGNVTQAGADTDNYGGFVNAPVATIDNKASVTNNGSIAGINNMGVAASAAVSATGAVASFAVSAVAASVEGKPAPDVVASSFGTLRQSAVNDGSIENTGVITFADAEDSAIVSTAASAAVSATGAVAATAFTLVNANLVPATDTGWVIGDIVQGANNTGAITNIGTITGDENEFSGTILAQGASVAVSATGAAASVSFSAVNSAMTLPNVNAGFDVTQFVNNVGVVNNSGNITKFDTLEQGASASVSATGAAASVGFNGNEATLTTSLIGNVIQNVINQNSVTNGGYISVGSLEQGASAAISATGAVASLAMSANGGSLAGATAAFGDATQTVTNTGNIENGDAEDFSVVDVYHLGTGASAAISATGALAAISLGSVGATVTDSVDLAGDYAQTVTNGVLVESVVTGNVSNFGNLGALNLANGASASVSASGAVASLSVSAINSTAKFSTITGSIDQVVLNKATVTNAGSVVAGSLADAASVAVSAAGAVAAISMSATAGTVSAGATLGTEGADIYQSAENTKDVTNSSGTLAQNPDPAVVGVTVSNLNGDGASAAISATGAVTSTNFSFNDTSLTGAPFTLSAITQDADSVGMVRNTGVMIVGDLIGSGASASISATGAVASVAYSTNETEISNSGVIFGGAIIQTSTNNSSVSNTGDLTLGVMSGKGASASISATGAVASVAYGVNSPSTANPDGINGSNVNFAAITQTATSENSVRNNGDITLSGDVPAAISGPGASASISATGAAASVAYSANTLNIEDSKVTFSGAIDQTATQSSQVVNLGTLTAGAITGTGASASISATGAVASTAYSLNFSDITVSETGLSSVTFSGAIDQVVSSTGSTSNTGTLTAGDISGIGAGASISASGAVASVAYSAVESTVTSADVTFSSPITQTTNNYESVINNGTLTAGNISGAGASVSISASGAVASTAYSTTGSSILSSNVSFNGTITQTAMNDSSITNSGRLTLGSIAGTGASASINASGAVSSFSVASIADTSPVGHATLGGAFIQSATNTANVTNTGVINFSSGAVTLGSGASAAISATGAATSVSFSNVK
jgi:filamentous hemagglutinin